jgi:hypothetical protein
VQRQNLIAGGNGTIGGVRRGEGLLVEPDHDRVERWVDGLDAPQVRLDHFADGDLPATDEGSQLCRAHSPQLGHHNHGTLTRRQ